jgi:hypothetical protein
MSTKERSTVALSQCGAGNTPLGLDEPVNWNSEKKLDILKLRFMTSWQETD